MRQESPFEVVILVASLAVVTTASSVIVRFDERRLTRAAERGDPRAVARLERAWPPPGRDNAIIGLALLGAPVVGLFAVWFHFFRTRSGALSRPWRWSLAGFCLGLAAVLAVLVVNAAVVIGIAYAAGLPLDD